MAQKGLGSLFEFLNRCLFCSRFYSRADREAFLQRGKLSAPHPSVRNIPEHHIMAVTIGFSWMGALKGNPY